MSTTQALATEKEARDVAESARETEWQHPSFVRELFLGRFRLDLIHPHPEIRTPTRRRVPGSSSGDFAPSSSATTPTRSIAPATSPSRPCSNCGTWGRSASRSPASTAASVFRR